MEVDARRALLLRPSYSVVRAPHLPAVRGAHGVRPAGHGAQRLRRGPHGKGDVPGWIYWSPANATLSSKRGYPKLRAQVHSGHSALKGVACKSAPRLESCPLDSHTHEPHAAQRLLQCVEQKLVALGPAACAAPKGVPLHVQCLFCATQRGRCLAQLSSFPQRPACAHACFAGCARVHIGKKESWAQGVTDALLLRLVTTGGLATKHDEARELRGRSRP